MNEPFDPLEAELQSLRPQELSLPARQQIANELATGVLNPARPWLSRVSWSGAATGGLVAACLAAGMLLLPAPKQTEIEPPLGPMQIPIAAAFDDALPTVWTYRRALTRSPRDLEVLLDKHASLAPLRGEPTPTHLFIRSDAELFLHGEL